LNTALLYMFVEFITVQYIISRIIVAVIVGIGFNFITHKYYIFK
jgi:putative flippase GtrA